MALCLGESLVINKGFDPHDQCIRYVNWWHHGYKSCTDKCFDIGNTTRAGLKDFLITGKSYREGQPVSAAGNGSLMRLSPVPIAYFRNVQEAIEWSGESSRTTHNVPVCVDACKFYGQLISIAIAGETKYGILGDYDLPYDKKLEHILMGSYEEKEPPEIKGTGYVVESLEAALWAFSSTRTFEQCILTAANLGDDADTTAAIAGQLAGAYYGAAAIPQQWLEKLAWADYIEELAERLYRMYEC